MTRGLPRVLLSGMAAIMALSMTTGAPAAASETGLPTLGQSLGGHWRERPELDGALLGTLPNGRQIQILEDTGTTYNGFNWFKIRVGNIWGYQWGGIICSNGDALPHRAAVCDPGNVLALGAGHKGLDGLAGDYAAISSASDGTSGADCNISPQVLLDTLSISGQEVEFHDRVCTVADATARRTGLHLTGTCSENRDLNPGVTPLTEYDRSLDVLAFQGEDGALALVTLSGPDKGMLSLYSFCGQ